MQLIHYLSSPNSRFKPSPLCRERIIITRLVKVFMTFEFVVREGVFRSTGRRGGNFVEAIIIFFKLPGGSYRIVVYYWDRRNCSRTVLARLSSALRRNRTRSFIEKMFRCREY